MKKKTSNESDFLPEHNLERLKHIGKIIFVGFQVRMFSKLGHAK
jgi:hypothetical protein